MKTNVIWVWATCVAIGCGVTTINDDAGFSWSGHRGRDAVSEAGGHSYDAWEEGTEDGGTAGEGDQTMAEELDAGNDVKPDGCIPCSADKIAGQKRTGCKYYTCDENGCLTESWVKFMGGCYEPEKCLHACAEGDTRPECGVCVCVGDDCASMECVSADQGAREEPDKDGCKGAEPCRTSTCQQVTKPDGGKSWECVDGPDLPDGTPCGDSDPCTLYTKCQGGQCIGIPMDCDDQNPCTTDTCVDPGVCAHEVQVGAPCDDSDPCTEEDRCLQDGTCAGTPKVCEPSGPCFRAWCEEGLCLEEALDGVECDDGDPCTEGDMCAAGSCVGQPVTCEPKAPCLTSRAVSEGGTCGCLDSVLPGWCYFQIDGQGTCVEVGKTDPSGCFKCVNSQEVTPLFLSGQPCNDNDPCTVGDLCSPALKRCAGTPVLVDPEPLPCQRPACDGKTPIVGVITDEGWCVSNGRCYPEGSKIGQCQWCGKDGEKWHVLPVNAGTPCDDGNPCTYGDACDNSGTCRPGWAYSCQPPQGGCATVTCDGKGGCSEPVWVPTSGKCLVKAGNQWVCIASGQSLGDPCYICDPARNPYGLVPAAPGTPCDPSDCCRTGGSCDGLGNCIPGPLATCDDNNPCTLDFCVTANCPPFPGAPPACDHKPVSSPKNCFDACGQAGTCVDGLCKTPLPCNPCPLGKCDDGDPCTEDSCDQVTGTCEHKPKDCDDANPCTTDRCDAGGQCAHDPVDCDDGDPCTQDACNPSSGLCMHEGLTGPACDDHNPCTEKDACQEGICRGVEIECPWSGRECFEPSCDASSGRCIEAPVADGEGCDDGNACTARDQCLSGVCLGLGACGGAVAFSGSQLIACDKVPLLGQAFTIYATARWDDASGPSAFQTIASLVGQDLNGKPHGVELLIGSATSPSAGYCAPARRLVLRVYQHGQVFLVGYTAQVKVPVGEWVPLAVVVGSGGVSFVVGTQVVSNTIRCDTGAPATALDIPQVPGLKAYVGGVAGADGLVANGAKITLSDLMVWDVAVPPGPPSYAYPNIWCLFVAETALEHQEVRPILALRLNYWDEVLIDEGKANATCSPFPKPGSPSAPTFQVSNEAFRTGCPK